MKEKIKAIKNLIYYTAGSYLEYFLGLLISIIIARSMPPSEYGTYAFLIWLSALGIILINNGINTAVIKFLAEERGKGRDGDAVFHHLRKTQLKFALIVTMMIVMMIVLGYELLYLENAFALLCLLAVSIFFRSIYMFYVSASKGLEKFKVTALTVLMVSPINLIIVFLISIKYASIEGYIIVYTIVSILYCLAVTYWLRNSFHSGARDLEPALRERISVHIKIVSVNVILGFIIYKQSELAFLKLFASAEDMAYYNVGFMLASSAMLLVPGVFSALLLPLMSRAGVEKDRCLSNIFLSSTRYLIFLSMPVAMIGILLSDTLIILLYGNDYLPSSIVLSTCLVSSAVAVSAHPATSYFMSSDNQKIIMKVFIIVACINIFLDIVLINLFGLKGAYWANLIASIVLSTLLVRSCIKSLNVRLEYFSYFKLLCISIIAGVPLWFAVNFSTSNTIVLLAILLFIPIYIGGSIMFDCWSKSDYKLFSFITKKAIPLAFLINYFEAKSSS